MHETMGLRGTDSLWILGLYERMSCWSVLTCSHSSPMGTLVKQCRSSKPNLREDDSLAERTPLSPDRVAEFLDMCL